MKTLENTPNPVTPSASGLHTVIVGDGWAALAVAGFLAGSGEQVTWIAGTGARLAFPLPALEFGLDGWRQLALVLGVDAIKTGDPFEVETGSFLRAYRTKAFREPEWIREGSAESAPNLNHPVNHPLICDEDELASIWPADRLWARQWRERLPIAFDELERQCRDALLDPKGRFAPVLTRIEGVPVQKLSGGRQASVAGGSAQLPSVTLADGREISGHRILFADRWESRGSEGLRSVLSEDLQGEAFAVLKGRDPVGVLQASFEHRAPIGAGVREGFCAALSRESGEKFERHVWGSFSDDGLRSTWTVCLTAEESEDNHEITKKLRRSRNLLEKMFSQEPWSSQGSFEATIVAEHVRFEEMYEYAGGKPPVSATELEGLHGVALLTDGYGPGSAMQQALTLVMGPAVDQRSLSEAARANSEPTSSG